jgi:hypothetical protein
MNGRYHRECYKLDVQLLLHLVSFFNPQFYWFFLGCFHLWRKSILQVVGCLFFGAKIPRCFGQLWAPENKMSLHNVVLNGEPLVATGVQLTWCHSPIRVDY